MTRRSLFALIAAVFTPKPKILAEPAITPDTPLVVLWETVSQDEFRRRYLQPAMAQMANDIDAQLLKDYRRDVEFIGGAQW